MKTRPNNLIKNLVRSKSPVIATGKAQPASNKISQKNMIFTQLEHYRFTSSDARLKHNTSPEPKTQKKTNDLNSHKDPSPKQQDSCRTNKRQKNVCSAKDEDDNTTEQSSQQHISYVAGQYQLDSYELFSKKKNVQFEEKTVELQRGEKMRSSLGKSSGRNSSILKNSNRVLDKSLATASDKSLSIQNSFTANKKYKIPIANTENTSLNITKKKYEGIIQQLKAKRGESRQIYQKYIDDLFPPVQASLFSTSVYKKVNLISKNKQEIVWLRLPEIFNTKNARIFSKTKKCKQVMTSDKNYSPPYLSCSFNAIKNNNELLAFMFQSEEVNPYGIYLVKIYQQSSWRYVIIDDLIPCIKRKGRVKRQQKYMPAFININQQPGDTTYLWPFLLEKAYANYYNSYQNLSFGNTIDFLSELTGAPYSQLSFVPKRNFKPNVQKNISILSKHICTQSSTVVGWIQSKQAYVPLFMVKDSYTNDNLSIGYNDLLSNETISLQVNEAANTFSSIFIFPFNQYQNSINCPVYPPKANKQKPKKTKDDKLKGKYIQISQNDTISIRTFTIFKKTKCCINLRQKENRFYYQCHTNQYLWVRCMFMQKQYDGGFRWIHGKYTNQKHIIFQQILEPGQYYLLIMVEWKEKHNKQLTVVLYSDCDFLKFQRKNYNKEQKIIELSCMDLAQRFGKLSQINKSICAYTYLCQETALIIQNIINERTKGDVTIMRSINGLKSKMQIIPINQQFEIEIPQEYASLEKGQNRRVINHSVQIDIKKGQNFTVVLRMKGGIDRKFFKVFNFG